MTDVTKPGVKPARPYLFFWSLRQAAGLSLQTWHRIARPLASREDRQGAPRPRHRSDARSACSCPIRIASASSPAPIPAPSRWRCGRCWARSPSPPSPGKASVKVGSPMPQAAEARSHDPARRLWQRARSFAGRLVERRAVHLERHHLRRARAQWRLDRGRPRGPQLLRRDFARCSPTTCLGTSSMSRPSRGRRCWAARAATAS
jgi:hypothetical protein